MSREPGYPHPAHPAQPNLPVPPGNQASRRPPLIQAETQFPTKQVAHPLCALISPSVNVQRS